MPNGAQDWLAGLEQIVIRGVMLLLLITAAARLVLAEVSGLLRMKELRWLRMLAAKIVEYLGNVDVTRSRGPRS